MPPCGCLRCHVAAPAAIAAADADYESARSCKAEARQRQQRAAALTQSMLPCRLRHGAHNSATRLRVLCHVTPFARLMRCCHFHMLPPPLLPLRHEVFAAMPPMPPLDAAIRLIQVPRARYALTEYTLTLEITRIHRTECWQTYTFISPCHATHAAVAYTTLCLFHTP